MSEQSTLPGLVELTSRQLEAANRGDLDAFMSVFALNAVYDASRDRLGVYEGQLAIRGLIGGWWAAFDDLRLTPEEFVDLGSGVGFAVLRHVQPAAPAMSIRAKRTSLNRQAIWSQGLRSTPISTKPEPPPNGSRRSRSGLTIHAPRRRLAYIDHRELRSCAVRIYRACRDGRRPEKAATSMRAVSEITVYEVNTCTTCLELARLLEEHGKAFDTVEYHVTGLTEPELRSLLDKADARPHEFLRQREATAVELDAAALDDDQLIAAMVANPALVQRPIVVRGDRAVLARPVERVLALLVD
jgi:arsenate reductase